MSPKGVQLSQLHQHNRCTVKYIGALETSTPLTNCTNTIGALLNIFGALETSAPPDCTP